MDKSITKMSSRASAIAILLILLLLQSSLNVSASTTVDEKKQNPEQEITLLVHSLRLYDEILTQSLRNYAYSNDIKWLKRYKEHQPKLDAVIHRFRELSPSDTLEQFNSINNNLYDIELNAIELIAAGNNNEAVLLLDSEKYNTEKALYLKLSQAVLDQSTIQTKLQTNESIENTANATFKSKLNAYEPACVKTVVHFLL